MMSAHPSHIFILAYPLLFEHPLLHYSLTAYLFDAPTMSSGSGPSPSVISVNSNTPPLPITEHIICPVRFVNQGLTRGEQVDQDEEMFPYNLDMPPMPISPQSTL